MPEINIEEKIQEALKKKSFKDNKAEYLGLSFIFGMILCIAFVVSYFLPWISILLLVFAFIPLLMGYKHFIWFGPASGETLMDGFKVSLICGYLNFVSYIKILFTSNIRAILWGIGAMFVGVFAGSNILQHALAGEIEMVTKGLGDNPTVDQLFDAFYSNGAIRYGMNLVTICAFLFSFLVFYFVKLKRILLPYVSFLRLTNLEGKSMNGVITHTNKILKGKRIRFYFKSTVCHLLYIVPFGISILVYLFLSKNPVYSDTTLSLVTVVAFFATVFIPMLFVELNNRNFCIEANQDFVKEHKKMLNDAINDLDSRNKR